jgi:serine/threonine protein kinase
LGILVADEGLMPNLSDEQWRSLSEHLDQALQMAPAELAGWLAALARSEPEVAAELQLKLQARDRTGFEAFLSESLTAGGFESGASLQGRQVGHYTIDSEIGRGGMGSVWRAHRTDGRFEGTVAIKFVHTYWLVRRTAEERFLAEGRLLGRLNHANIARLIDAGLFDESMPYLVLEYVEGEPIDEYCERRQLSAESRVALFRDVLAAVDHAHSHLIIHRDLKPTNILVTHEGVAKLLDFGIAKLLGEEASAAQTVLPALTPQYAAPEQLQAQGVTTATDVYALGLVLYRLLTGLHCVQIDGRSTADIYHAIIKESPIRPSQLPDLSAARRRALEGDLDNILGKALKKDPIERYASVGALSEDLRRFLAHEPVQARPDSVSYRLTKFVRRNRGSVLGGALIALGLIGTSAFALMQMHTARSQRDLALQEATRAGAESDLAQYILDDRLSKLTPQAEHERLDRARAFMRARFQAQPALAAILLIDLSGRYIDLGDFTTAADVIVEAERIGHRIDDANVLGQIACLRTEDLAIARNYEAARVQLAAGMVQMQRLHPVPWQVEAECATAEAFVLQAEGSFDLPVTHLRQTLDHLEADGLRGSGRYFSSSNDLARAYLLAGRYRSAFETSSANEQLLLQLGRADTFTSAIYVTIACMALRGGGQPRRALEYLTANTASMRQGNSDESLPASTIGCRGAALLDIGELEAAQPAIVLAMQKAERGAATYVASQYRALAVAVAIARGDLPAAEALWEPLANEEPQRLAANQKGIEVTRVLLVHARMDLARGHPDDALSALSRAELIVQRRSQHSDPDALEIETCRTYALLAKGRYAEARVRAQSAIELARASAIDPTSSYHVGEALLLRSRAEAALKDEAAAASAAEALPHLIANIDANNPLLAEARQRAVGR